MDFTYFFLWFIDFHEPAQYGEEGGYQKPKGKPVQEEKPIETVEKKTEESTRKPFGFTRGGCYLKNNFIFEKNRFLP